MNDDEIKRALQHLRPPEEIYPPEALRSLDGVPFIDARIVPVATKWEPVTIERAGVNVYPVPVAEKVTAVRETRRPEFAVDVLDAIVHCPGLTARGLAQELGINVPAVYNSTRWLEARGEVVRSDDWPAGWFPSEEGPVVVDDCDDLDAVAQLLDEAMALPSWSLVPADVRHKVEHAKVQIMRARGEVG